MPNSIQQINKNKDVFSIYPNPNSGSFDVKFNKKHFEEESTLRITDITGYELFEKQISGKEGTITLNLNLAQGIYFISLKGKDGKITQSFFVQ